MKKKYYGILGDNGFGIYDNYDRVLASRGYLTGYCIKGFKTITEAKKFAVTEYNLRQDQYSENEMFDLNKPIKLNWIYFRNKMNK